MVSGPSGVGKGTLVEKLLERVPYLCLSISAATRKPRQDEKQEVDYYFLSKEEFADRLKKEKFLEWANVYGNYYGTSLKFVNERIKKGKSVVLEIDIQGARQVKEKVKDAVLIFIAPPSFKELKKRLEARQTENAQALKNRLEKATFELQLKDEFNYQVVNDKLERAVEELVEIVKRETNDK